MKWITRERPKIDRIACPWLVARFIDRQPEFLYVAPEDVMKVALYAACGGDIHNTPMSTRGDNNE